MERAIPLLALLALLAPAVVAQEVPDAPVSFLVFHAQGGRDADPLAGAQAPPPAAAQRLPATFVDGARADQAPENAPERALAHFRELQRLVSRAEATPAGAELTLSATARDGILSIALDSDRTAGLSVVVFEHGVPLDGQPQPYVARYASTTTNASELDLGVALDPTWDVGRLGVVAIAREGDTVLQSATWTASQGAPTVQRARSVLVEHVTASWCDPCAPADEAVALLATQRGAAGPLEAGDVRYLRAPSWTLYAGLLLGAAAAILVLRRRDA